MEAEKVIEALIDANRRLIKENAALAKEVETVKAVACNEATQRRAWMRTASACDAYDVYGAVYAKALSDVPAGELRLHYLTLAGILAPASGH